MSFSSSDTVLPAPAADRDTRDPAAGDRATCDRASGDEAVGGRPLPAGPGLARARLALWIAVLAGSVLTLSAVGHGQLAGPPLGGPGALAAWAGGRSAGILCLAVMRFVALAVAWYLLGVTAFGVITRMLGLFSAYKVVERMTLPRLRRLVAGFAAVLAGAGGAANVTVTSLGAAVTGVAVVGAAIVSTPAGASASSADSGATGHSTPPVMIRLPSLPGPGVGPAPQGEPPGGGAHGGGASPGEPAPAAPPTGGSPSAAPPPGGPGPAGPGPSLAPQPPIFAGAATPAPGPSSLPVPTQAPGGSGRAGTQSAPTTAASGRSQGARSPARDASRTRVERVGDTTAGAQPGAPTTSAASPAPAAPPAAPTNWTVAPGDNLWSIAAACLARDDGHRATDAEIVPYWDQLIALNRSRLVVAGDPDLIFPGQVLSLPPLAPAPPAAP